MESTATLRFNGTSAQKMRQVADLVRGKDVDVALHSLRFVTKASARPLEKLITSAVANAREKANAADERFDPDVLYVKTVMVDEGPTMKRFRPRAQGRAYRIRKRSCHVNLVLAEHAQRPVKPQPPKKAAAKAAPADEGKKGKSGAKREKKPKAAAAAK
jgi:large subunit ribosomal protein L22